MGATVLILGSGGREHALAVTYLKSPKVDKVVVAPGNPWMAITNGKIEVDSNCSLKDPNSMLNVAKKHTPVLVDVAQDDALAHGTVDLLTSNGFRVFGPTQAAARIEWDKAWARQFMERVGIPSPEYRVFTDLETALDYVAEIYASEPKKCLFIKASGLAAGKGALKATCLQEAKTAIEKMKSFGEAGKKFVIEDGLEGEEFSFYALCYGDGYVPLMSAQDHKRQFDHDLGDQTGGMGVIAPTSATNGLEEEIATKFIAPVISNLNKDGTPYVGILYFSGIITSNGIYAIEYNARWGDPECQAILPGLKGDYFDLVNQCIEHNLMPSKIQFDERIRICLVGASFGYPNDYSKVRGRRLLGIENLTENVLFFSAGLAEENGFPVANGGRLFSLVTDGNDVVEARTKAYAAMASLIIDGNLLHYRTDIGWRDMLRHLNSQ